MKNEQVKPSQLHKNLERAKDAVDQRLEILADTLQSQNLAVIRRIPEVLAPLNAEEIELIIAWAKVQLKNDSVAARDFAFHLMASCGVPGNEILDILKQFKTYSENALSHIREVLGAGVAAVELDKYLVEVAEKLLTEERVASRDRGRHVLMTLAKAEDQWLQLATRFTQSEISDLRQNVIERFISDCPDGQALDLFSGNVCAMCLGRLIELDENENRLAVSYAHWVITCRERQGKIDKIREAGKIFEMRFGRDFPRSVEYRLAAFNQVIQEPIVNDVPAYQSSESSRGFDSIVPVRTVKPMKPRTVEGALEDGWTIRKESGRQVVLFKDGKSLTLYRPKG